MRKTNVSLNLSRLEAQVFATALLFAEREMTGLTENIRKRMKLMAVRIESELMRLAEEEEEP